MADSAARTAADLAVAPAGVRAGDAIRDYAYYKNVFAGQPMPFAFVDLDCLDANIEAIARRAQGRPVRVASKSVRCRAVLRRILDFGAPYFGIMAFTAPEAIWLAEQGFDDLLIGYPIWHEAHIRGVAEASRGVQRIVMMVDSIPHVERIESVLAGTDLVAKVCIDIDMGSDFPGLHFGVLRTPITEPEGALALARRIRELPHVELEGLMGYEAQIAGLPDAVPGQGVKNAFVRFLKQRSIRELSARRARIVDALKQAGEPLAFVNGGGTGSIESTLTEDYVTELTAGSGFYTPALFDGYRQFRHLPAAGYAIAIVRKPKPGVVTCQGGGYPASGGLGPDKLPKPYLPEGAALTSMEAAGEVQTPIAYDGPETLELGGPVFMRHAKAGELAERFNAFLLVANGEIIGEAPTYRGEGKCFL